MMVTEELNYSYYLETINSPFWAFAIHDGHQISDKLSPYLIIDKENRLREEDPYTAEIAKLPFNKLVIGTSRFQLDINRREEDAMYLEPRQAWGLNVWCQDLPKHLITKNYQCYNHIYTLVEQAIQNTIDQYGFFVIYDIHSYNARRQGPKTKIDTENNPQIIMGTTYNHPKWRPLTDLLVSSLRKEIDGQNTYDVRENIKFKGGHLTQHLNAKYSDKGCIFSIEFRKDFMDEWTSEAYPEKIQEYNQLLLSSVKTLTNYFVYEKS